MTSKRDIEKVSSKSVTDFLADVKAMPRASGGDAARLVFALDATASRQPSWDRASALHAEMFTEAGRHGGLSVQLCFYRGAAELRRSRFVDRPEALLKAMSVVRCAAGLTQVGRLLEHVRRECAERRLRALVFIGDAFEENIDTIADVAGELGVLGCPVFMFQEGNDAQATFAFRTIAERSGGAYCQFDEGSVSQLRELLRAVGAFVAGGRAALADLSARGKLSASLTRQLGVDR